MAGQRLRRNKVVMPILVLVAAYLPCHLAPYLFSMTPPDDVQTRVHFHFQHGVWTEAPPIEGGVNRIAVSERRVVWAIPQSEGGVSRLENGGWIHDGLAEPGKRPYWPKLDPPPVRLVLVAPASSRIATASLFLSASAPCANVDTEQQNIDVSNTRCIARHIE